MATPFTSTPTVRAEGSVIGLIIALAILLILGTLFVVYGLPEPQSVSNDPAEVRVVLPVSEMSQSPTP